MLTQRLKNALHNKNQPVDPYAELQEVLGGVGLNAEDSGGEITFVGADPIVPSTLSLAAAPGIALVGKSVALADLWQLRGGPGQDISMDLRKAPHRLCPFYDRKWETLNGMLPPMMDPAAEAVAAPRFYRTADDRHVMPVPVYPKLKSDLLALLGATDSAESVARQVRTWNSTELEEAAAGAGVVLTKALGLEELMAQRQFTEVLADMPLVVVEKIGDSDPEPMPSGGTAPLDGLRALGHAHIIAGAGIGRTLALHGADVLNVWRAREVELDLLYQTANVAVRSAFLDLDTGDGAGKMRDLLRGADIFYANRRVGYLDRHGLSPADAAAIRPGIIHVSNSLFGQTGPWADRVGFDQNAGVATGMTILEGTPDAPQLPIIGVVNDWIMPWMSTIGIAAALRRRATEGGSYRVHVCLSRVALWTLSLGIFDKDYVAATLDSGDEHRYLDPDLFTMDGPAGIYQGVTEQVQMSQTPGRYRFGLEPRGSSRPEWLPA
ncbi:CoA transferase [Nocardia sp. NPDC051756]|uniref:CoA transferase n=1 Tax=Nocardia sp. NPDC051756 TaxID=3154751 RepID=UPI00343B6CC7